MKEERQRTLFTEVCDSKNGDFKLSYDTAVAYSRPRNPFDPLPIVRSMSRYRKNFGRFQKPQELVLRKYNLYSCDRNTIFNRIRPSPEKI